MALNIYELLSAYFCNRWWAQACCVVYLMIMVVIHIHLSISETLPVLLRSRWDRSKIMFSRCSLRDFWAMYSWKMDLSEIPKGCRLIDESFRLNLFGTGSRGLTYFGFTGKKDDMVLVKFNQLKTWFHRTVDFLWGKLEKQILLTLSHCIIVNCVYISLMSFVWLSSPRGAPSALLNQSIDELCQPNTNTWTDRLTSACRLTCILPKHIHLHCDPSSSPHTHSFPWAYPAPSAIKHQLFLLLWPTSHWETHILSDRNSFTIYRINISFLTVKLFNVVDIQFHKIVHWQKLNQIKYHTFTTQKHK